MITSIVRHASQQCLRKSSSFEFLRILDRVEKVQHTTSFIKYLFIGQYDKYILNYPSLLETKQEWDLIFNQSSYAKSNFHTAAKDGQLLKAMGFLDIWKGSTTEMVSIFEAIGCSLGQSLPYPVDGKHVATQEHHECPLNDSRIVDSLIKMLLHNCLSYSALDECDNEAVKSSIIQADRRIGFAWCEKALPLGSGYHTDWKSEAKLSEDGQSWTISGAKDFIYKADYDSYLGE